MRTIVHYDPKTGDVIHAARFFTAFEFRGLPYAVVDIEHRKFSHDDHVVDLSSLGEGDDGLPTARIMERPTESHAAREAEAKIRMVAILVGRRNDKLKATDALMVVPSDRPDAVDLAPWKDYRQKLRDLGTFKTSSEIMAAWPVRPDGADDLSDLR